MPLSSNEDLYRCAPMISFPMGSSSVLAYFPLTHTARLLPPYEVDALRSCGTFRTLTDHADQLCMGITGSEQAIREQLAELVNVGGMVSYQDLVVRANRDASTDGDGITWISIPTCDRHDQLLRALESYFSNSLRHGRTFRWFVADDSQSADQRELCRQTLRSLAAKFQAAVFYAGREEKERYVEAMIADGDIPPAVVRFALLGSGDISNTVGANRNAILLQTYGTLLLSVHDDTICQAARAPDSSEAQHLRVGWDGDPVGTWFFRNREEVLRFPSWEELDVIREHERLLGRSLATCIDSMGPSNVDLDQACTHLLLNLCTGQGRVRMTSNGLIGDSGMHASLPLLMCTDESTRDRLIDTEDAWRNAISSREILRHAPCFTITHHEPCMATCVGIDNRDLLPAFFPICGNEDGIFARTVEQCTEGTFTAHVPWAIVHAPSESRTYAANPTSSLRISDIIIACIASWTPIAKPCSTSERLQSVGRHLSELSVLGPDDFTDVMRTLMWTSTSRLISRQESLLQRYGAYPLYWAAEIRRHIDNARQAAADPNYILPSDLADCTHEGTERVRQLVGQFGQLLYWWPAIVEKAEALCKEGQQPGQRLT